MTYCEITGFPIPDISPPEYWVMVLDVHRNVYLAQSVHQSRSEAEAVCPDIGAYVV